MLIQIVFGSGLLIACALLHVALVAAGIPLLVKVAARIQGWRDSRRISVLLITGITLVLLAHTIEVWLWAASFALIGGFDSFASSFYFATVTYTTLGYGDVVIGPEGRIFASFAAITGLLTFGISTAFLIGLLTRVMPDVFNR